MNEKRIVRSAILSEREALESLQRRASLVWEEYRDSLLANPDAIKLSDNYITDGHTLVAECDGITVGFAVVLPRDDGDAEPDGLFVEPEQWRKGIGTRLIRDVELLAINRGSRFLYVVGNPRAKEFYSASGFIIIGEQSTRFGVGFIMRKSIGTI